MHLANEVHCGSKLLTPSVPQREQCVRSLLLYSLLMTLLPQVKCSEAQVREYFTRLRSSVRNFMQKLQRKASGVPVGSHAAPAASGIPSATPGSPPDPAAAGSEDPAGAHDSRWAGAPSDIMRTCPLSP